MVPAQGPESKAEDPELKGFPQQWGRERSSGPLVSLLIEKLCSAGAGPWAVLTLRQTVDGFDRMGCVGSCAFL